MIIEQSMEWGKPLVHHWYRKDSRKVHNVYKDYAPYFYVLEEAEVPKDGAVLRQETGFISIYGEKVKKVVVRTPQDVGRLRVFFAKHYEADLQYHYRYFIDHELEFGDKPQIMYLDIEIDFKRGKFPDCFLTEEPIISITTFNEITDSYTSFFLKMPNLPFGSSMRTWKSLLPDVPEKKWLVANFETEKQMLATFVRHVQKVDPDLLTGWNTDKFDLPYLLNRMRKLGVQERGLSPIGSAYVKPPTRRLATGKMEENPPVIKGRIIFDLLPFYKKMNSGETEFNDLDTVANRELGSAKVKYAGKLYELYQRDPEMLLTYNCGDVELAMQIDRKVHITDTFWELSKFVRCRMEQTFSESQMIDMYQLWYNKNEFHRVLPSKTPTPSQTFEGATVIDPEPDIYANAIVLDLEKLYPSIILSCNLSPETKVIDPNEQGNFIVLPNGLRFRKMEAFSPGVLKKLFEVENHFKRQMKQFAIGSPEYDRARRTAQFTKDLRNSYYGILSYEGARCYVPEVGASITLMGREMLAWCQERIKERSYRIIGGDTDSLFILGKGKDTQDIVEEAQHLKEHLNASFDDFAKKYNIDKHYFRIDYKCTYAPFMITAKKRYAGMVRHVKDRLEKDFLEIKGFEPRRSDNNQFTRDFMVQLFRLIMETYQKHDGTMRFNEINSFIIAKVKQVRELPIEQLALKVSFNKGLDEYEKENCYTLGARYAMQNLGCVIGKGTKCLYIFSRHLQFNNKRLAGVCFEDPEQYQGIEPDYDYMTQRLVLNKVRNIYEPMGWEIAGIGVAMRKNGKFDLGQKTLMGVLKQ